MQANYTKNDCNVKMIFNHVVAQWSKKARFHVKASFEQPNSRGVWPYAPTTSTEQPYLHAIA
ncbi:MAG: hypothetical protein B6242_10590 [Anaerolineaceae bacterium 4572_78]|nr:MAG: hypothetical protein B6242_10590 [Anaerolineaceae bacterium 4572_78]